MNHTYLAFLLMLDELTQAPDERVLGACEALQAHSVAQRAQEQRRGAAA